MKHKKIHFIGIGGAGMSVLAQIMLEKGLQVTGSDLEDNSKCAALRAQGVEIFIGHSASNFPANAKLTVFSSAVKPDNAELLRSHELGVLCQKRGEFLAEVAKSYQRSVAVTGAHGKSSVSALIVHLLKKCGCNPGFMIGAALRNAPSGAAGDGDVFITEADESDGSNILQEPYLGVVTEVDDDHAWSVGGASRLEENYLKFAKRCAKLIYCGQKSHALYGNVANAQQMMDFSLGRNWIGFERNNLNLALSVVRALGYDATPEMAEDFAGVARRMTVRVEAKNLLCIEDYAHHPQELEAAIKYWRIKYPNRHLRVVFQPHRYARLECYFDRFVEILKQADSVMVLPVFAAWCETGSLDGAALAVAVGAKYGSLDWAENARLAKLNLPDEPCLLAIVGAGDLDRIFQYL